jgi:hypothetical protein
MRFRRKLLRRYPHGRFVLMLLYFGSKKETTKIDKEIVSLRPLPGTTHENITNNDAIGCQIAPR